MHTIRFLLAALIPISLAAADAVVPPFLGVATEPVPPPLAVEAQLDPGFGLHVAHVAPESPAAAAGVQRGDVLVSIDGQELVNPPQLRALIARHAVDDELTLTIARKGKRSEVLARLAERPPELAPPLPQLEVPMAGGEPLGMDDPRFSFPEIERMLHDQQGFERMQELHERMREVREQLHSQMQQLRADVRELQMPEAQERSHFSSRMQLKKGGLSVTVTEDETGKRVHAENEQGEVLVDQLITRPEDWDAVPAEVRELVERSKVSVEMHARPPRQPRPEPLPLPQGEMH